MNENEFFEAIYRVNLNSVKQCIIEKGMDPNQAHSGGGHTPLQAACQIDSAESVELLLGLGASPNGTFTRRDVGGRIIEKDSTPICSIKSKKVGLLLLGAGADIEWTDGFGFTPLIWAIRRRSLEVVNFLLESGADKDRELEVQGEKMDALKFVEKEIFSNRSIFGEKITDKQKAFLQDYEDIKKAISSV